MLAITHARLCNLTVENRVKILFGAAIGLTIASAVLYFYFGPKGFVYLLAMLIAQLSGYLFLKAFKP